MSDRFLNETDIGKGRSWLIMDEAYHASITDQPNDKGTGLLQRLQASGSRPPPLDLSYIHRALTEAGGSLEADPDDDAAPAKRTRNRKPTVANVIRQMKRAGLEVAGCEINPRDGMVRVLSGKPVGGEVDTDDTGSAVDRSEWN